MVLGNTFWKWSIKIAISNYGWVTSIEFAHLLKIKENWKMSEINEADIEQEAQYHDPW